MIAILKLLKKIEITDMLLDYEKILKFDRSQRTVGIFLLRIKKLAGVELFSAQISFYMNLNDVSKFNNNSKIIFWW